MKKQINMLMLVALVFLTTVPAQTFAKKIKYGVNIVYNGAVDTNGNPKGKGTLTTTYGIGTDVLEGIFDNGTVVDASLRFNIIRKRIEYGEYSGKVEFKVSEDGSSVTYKLFDPNLHWWYNFNLEDNYPIEITRTPNGNECSITVAPLFSIRATEDGFDVNNAIRPFTRTELRQFFKEGFNTFGKVETSRKIQLTGEKKPKLLQSHNIINLIGEGENKGAVIISSNDFTTLVFPDHADYCKFLKDGKEPVKFQKKYKDNITIRKEEGDDIVRYKKGETSGIALLASFSDPHEFVQKIMLPSDSSAGSVVAYYTDSFAELAEKAIKGDADAQYLLGKEHYEGKTLKKNFEMANFWLKKAEALGHTEARRYFTEIWLEKDLADRKQKAMSSGSAADYSYVGDMYKSNIYHNLDSALVWYEKAAKINSWYQRDVVALKYNMKTGRDYYEDQEKQAIQNRLDRIAAVRAKYTKKYGATYSNSLSKEGYITPGMPIAFIKEYVNDYNSIVGDNLRLFSYQPTIRDMTQYGRSVQIYRLFLGNSCIWYFWVLNGKVVATSQQHGLVDVISLDRDW